MLSAQREWKQTTRVASAYVQSILWAALQSSYQNNGNGMLSDNLFGNGQHIAVLQLQYTSKDGMYKNTIYVTYLDCPCFFFSSWKNL